MKNVLNRALIVNCGPWTNVICVRLMEQLGLITGWCFGFRLRVRLRFGTVGWLEVLFAEKRTANRIPTRAHMHWRNYGLVAV